MTSYKPLTPKLRSDILDSINSQINDLNTCQMTPFVSVQKVGLNALENLFRVLPDGYPIPFERAGK